MVDPMTTDIAAPAPRRRAYLDRLGDYTPADEYPTESDELGRRVPVQRARYGFDERQTWSLDYTMVELLFERLCMFQDLNFWQQTDGEICEFEGEKITKRWAIDELIRLGELILSGHTDRNREANAQRFWTLWATVHPWMWS